MEPRVSPRLLQEFIQIVILSEDGASPLARATLRSTSYTKSLSRTVSVVGSPESLHKVLETIRLGKCCAEHVKLATSGSTVVLWKFQDTASEGLIDQLRCTGAKVKNVLMLEDYLDSNRIPLAKWAKFKSFFVRFDTCGTSVAPSRTFSQVFNVQTLPPPFLPGFSIRPALTAQEQTDLLNKINGISWECSLNRRVQHFGYRFLYGSRHIDLNSANAAPIPAFIQVFIEQAIKKKWITTLPNQVTINEYLPGQGIGFHIDTHSDFDEEISILSLGSAIDFCMRDPTSAVNEINYKLDPGSFVVMTGSARYAYLHGIKTRKYDYDAHTGLPVPRGRRVSVTLRHTGSRNGCLLGKCCYPQFCDLMNANFHKKADFIIDLKS